MNFNPHHHAGGDNTGEEKAHQGQNFNPHHHAGGDSDAHPFDVILL